MADGQFDGIIVGGGYNGLTLAGYMARQGLDVLVLERRMSYGGATITEEVTRPGFYHNLHAKQQGWQPVHLNGRVGWTPPKWIDPEQKPRYNLLHIPPPDHS